MKNFFLISVITFTFVFSTGCAKNESVFSNTTADCSTACAKVIPSQTLPEISVSELKSGMYYGSLEEKRKGTPNNWIHILRETESSAWSSPLKTSESCDCNKTTNQQPKSKAYYDNFRKICRQETENKNCCLSSVDNAERNDSLVYKDASVDKITCPKESEPDMNRCGGGYIWCKKKKDIQTMNKQLDTSSTTQQSSGKISNSNSSSTTDAISSTKIYRNNEYKFSFGYPSNYRLKEKSLKNDDPNQFGFYYLIQLSDETVNNLDTNNQKSIMIIVEKAGTNPLRTPNGLDPSSKVNTSIDGQKAVNLNNGEIFVVSKDDYRYRLWLGSEINAKTKIAFAQIISSFIFTK